MTRRRWVLTTKQYSNGDWSCFCECEVRLRKLNKAAFQKPAEQQLHRVAHWAGLQVNEAMSITKRYFTSLFSMRS